MDKDIREDIVNEKEAQQERRRTGRHTWIGERNPDAVIDWSEDASVRRQGEERSVSRDTGAMSPEKTRVVERQKRPYTGFITDEQIEENQRIFGLDSRKTRMVTREERAELYKTKVFDGTVDGSRADSGSGAEKARWRAGRKAGAERRKPDGSAYRVIRFSDDGKARRLITVLVLFAVLLAAEIGYVMMRSSSAGLPAKAEAVRKEAAALEKDNKKLSKELKAYGDYDQKKELKESWDRLAEKLGGLDEDDEGDGAEGEAANDSDGKTADDAAE